MASVIQRVNRQQQQRFLIEAEGQIKPNGERRKKIVAYMLAAAMTKLLEETGDRRQETEFRIQNS
jgi:hypothetical protein